MCGIKITKEKIQTPTELSPRVVVLRPVSQRSQTSQVPRPISQHSHHSHTSPRQSYHSYTSPRPSQHSYTSPRQSHHSYTSPRHSQTSTHTPIPAEYVLGPPQPRIIQVTPPSASGQIPRISYERISTTSNARRSDTSIKSARQVELSRGNSRHSRHGSRGASAGEKIVFVDPVVDRARSGSRSRGGGSGQRVSFGEAEGRRRLSGTHGDGGSVRPGSQSRAEDERRRSVVVVEDDIDAVEMARPRDRSRSFTYESNFRSSGAVGNDRQRVVVEEEDGRRRVIYIPQKGKAGEK